MNTPAAIIVAVLALLVAVPASASVECSRPKTRIGVINFVGGDCTRARVAAVHETRWGKSKSEAESASGNTSYQNHHRWYSPDLGRYLSSEPLAKSPGYMAAMGGAGMSVPSYSYALNDPLRFIDSSGLAPGDPFLTPTEAAIDVLNWANVNYPIYLWEYAGTIYSKETAKGERWFATPPATRRERLNSYPFDSMPPDGISVAATYHTHPWTQACVGTSRCADEDDGFNTLDKASCKVPDFLRRADGRIMLGKNTKILSMKPFNVDPRGWVEKFVTQDAIPWRHPHVLPFEPLPGTPWP